MVTPFGQATSKLLAMSPERRRVRMILSAVIFIAILELAGAPLWAALAFGNVVYTLDEILLVLVARLAVAVPEEATDG
jgi:hypothetical protein